MNRQSNSALKIVLANLGLYGQDRCVFWHKIGAAALIDDSSVFAAAPEGNQLVDVIVL